MGNLNNHNNLNTITLQKDHSQNNKINSDTSSISISSDKNIIKLNENKIHNKLFNSTNCGLSGRHDNDFFLKKRKRYIKNNKFVYVHPGSAAAKKMELEKVKILNDNYLY
jgi:hypothetical protein